MIISDAHRQAVADAAAEELLRLIYGDDFKGCSVRLETVSALMARVLKEQSEDAQSVRELYEKANEALHLLATPPPNGASLAPGELSALLGERLDAIFVLTRKLMDTAHALESQGQAEPDSSHP